MMPQSPARQVLDLAAQMGRMGDSEIVHASKGDRIIPVERQTKKVKELLKKLYEEANLKPTRFTVGGRAKRNPLTKLMEFAVDSGGGDSASGGGDPRGEGSTPGARGGEVEGPGGLGLGDNGPGSDGQGGPTAAAAEATGAPVSGTRSSTAVEQGQGYGSPQTASSTSIDQAKSTRTAGFLGEDPSYTESDLSLGNRLGNAFQSSVATPFASDPFGFIASNLIDFGLGFAGPIGLGVKAASYGITGQSPGSNVASVAKGQGFGQGGLIGQIGGNPTVGGSVGSSVGTSLGKDTIDIGGMDASMDDILKRAGIAA